MHHERKLVHRDLKSANVLITDDWVAKLTDFGDAIKGMNAVESLRGTPAWLAPEALSDSVLTSKADIYSFGMILWELLTFQSPPFICVEQERILPDEFHKGHVSPYNKRRQPAAAALGALSDTISSDGVVGSYMSPSLHGNSSDLNLPLLTSLSSDAGDEHSASNRTSRAVDGDDNVERKRAESIASTPGTKKIVLSHVSAVLKYVVREKRRPPIPLGCPKELASIMSRCWAHDPNERPEVEEIVTVLETMLPHVTPVHFPFLTSM